MDQPFIAAYWKDRKEERWQCARRCAEFLERLQVCPELSHWYFQSRSTKSVRKPVPVQAKELEPLLTTNNDETTGSPILELGFNFAAWNGEPEPADALLLISCGKFDSPVPNSVLLYMPEMKQPVRSHLQDYRFAMETMIECFDPDEAVATSRERKKASSPDSWRREGHLNYSKGGQVVEGRP